MSLNQGRDYLAIPGPSVTPDRVLRAMHRTSPNIYEGELVDMVPGVLSDLEALAGTSGNAVIYIANGHGVWEAASSNVFSRGDKALILATGLFAHGWSEMTNMLGVETEILDFGLSSSVDPEKLAERLAADTAQEFKAVMMVQVDTGTSVKNDVLAVRKALDKAGHPALLMVDCIACLGCDEFHMDDWGVDLMVTGSQKGLMTPPGCGFLFYNDKADKARETANCVTSYWDWRARTNPEIFYLYFCGTAPTNHLYGIREALDMMKEEGREHIWQRHDVLARAVWAAVEHWGKSGEIFLNIKDASARSRAVTTVHVPSGKSIKLQDWCRDIAGLTLGLGLGMEEPEEYFRIGHMGHVNAQMVLGALATIEAGLKAVGIAHEAGGAAVAAEVISAR